MIHDMIRPVKSQCFVAFEPFKLERPQRMPLDHVISVVNESRSFAFLLILFSKATFR